MKKVVFVWLMCMSVLQVQCADTKNQNIPDLRSYLWHETLKRHLHPVHLIVPIPKTNAFVSADVGNKRLVVWFKKNGRYKNTNAFSVRHVCENGAYFEVMPDTRGFQLTALSPEDVKTLSLAEGYDINRCHYIDDVLGQILWRARQAHPSNGDFPIGDQAVCYNRYISNDTGEDNAKASTCGPNSTPLDVGQSKSNIKSYSRVPNEKTGNLVLGLENGLIEVWRPLAGKTFTQ